MWDLLLLGNQLLGADLLFCVWLKGTQFPAHYSHMSSMLWAGLQTKLERMGRAGGATSRLQHAGRRGAPAAAQH